MVYLNQPDKLKVRGANAKMKSLKANTKGSIYVYLVLIVSLFALIFFALLFSTMIQSVQEGMNPYLDVTSWVDAEHFNTFYLAASLVTNVWTYIIGLIIFGLMYWVWIATQRKGVN